MFDEFFPFSFNLIKLSILLHINNHLFHKNSIGQSFCIWDAQITLPKCPNIFNLQKYIKYQYSIGIHLCTYTTYFHYNIHTLHLEYSSLDFPVLSEINAAVLEANSIADKISFMLLLKDSAFILFL